MAKSIILSDASERLVWRLPAPLETAISVSANRQTSGATEPYLGRTLSGGRLHSISKESVSREPRPSIAVTIFALESWPSQWEEYHEHVDLDDEGCEFAPDDNDSPGELLRCYGERRPEDPSPIIVTASTESFVTIHDYVSTVHSWLMEHWGAISAAVNVWNGGDAPVGQKLFVDISNTASVNICDEQTWQHCLVNRVPKIVQQVNTHPLGLQRVATAKPMSPERIMWLNSILREQGKDYQYPEP